MVDHEDRQRWRVAMLDRLYDEVDADTRSLASGSQVARAAGVPPDQATKVATYLEEAGLIKGIWSMGGQMPDLQITVYGIDQIEKARSQPTEPTTHLAPVNVLINQGTMTGVQQGGEGNVQHVQAQVNDVAGLLGAVQNLREALADFGGDIELATAQIDTIEAQARSGKPLETVVRAAFEALKQIGYNMVASGAMDEIGQILG